jgi:hypothetical protein
MRDPTPENHDALAKEVAHRSRTDQIFQDAFGHHMEAVKKGTTPLPTDFTCYRNLISAFEEKCGRFDDYSLKYAKALVAECEAIKAYPAALDSTIHRLNKVCQP